MKSRTSRLLVPAAALLAIVLAGPVAANGPFTLTVTEKEPPPEIADEMRALFAPTSYAIGNEDGVFFEYWFVKEVPMDAATTDSKEATENIPKMALLGAAVVHEPDHHDFRDDPIDPGVYTMRMAIQPADGNHIGTAPNDTFLVLLRDEDDRTLDGFFDHEEMIEIASEPTAAFHPPIFALQPVGEAQGDTPRLDVGDEDWQILVMTFPMKHGEDEVKQIPVQIVFEGIGHL